MKAATFALLFFLPFAGFAGALPLVYAPPASTHVIRIWGTPELQSIVLRWSGAFKLLHPETRIEPRLTGSDVAMAGLYTGKADLAVIGREATAPEIKAFEWIFRCKPARVELLTGAVDASGRSPALVFYVSADNPLTQLTLAQADALFGYERRRGGETLIQTWGQLGLTGEWQDRLIHLYAPDTESGTGRFLREAVLGGSRHLQWDRLTEFSDTKASGNGTHDAGKKILAALATDRFGLAVTGGGVAAATLKPLALAVDSQSEAVRATRQSVGARTYPLARPVVAYFNRGKGEPVDPVLLEFLRFVLGSTDGQVVSELDGYLPLPSGRAADHLKQLE